MLDIELSMFWRGSVGRFVATVGLGPTAVANDNGVCTLFSALPAIRSPPSLTAGPLFLNAYLSLLLLATLSGFGLVASPGFFLVPIFGFPILSFYDVLSHSICANDPDTTHPSTHTPVLGSTYSCTNRT
jgi:hypothetical protein